MCGRSAIICARVDHCDSATTDCGGQVVFATNLPFFCGKTADTTGRATYRASTSVGGQQADFGGTPKQGEKVGDDEGDDAVEAGTEVDADKTQSVM